ncbi:MAG: 4-alpha-glucanotransferase, partial [Oscillospiraceae bacterium]|nr:4-alpha-glucanotransferase [Oscillospiraceae bacterium]
TGTHDNQTLKGWLEDSDKNTIKYAKKYLRVRKKSEIPDAIIACAWQSIAELSVAQMQDFLNAGKSGRMNTPSVLGGNWQYRTCEEDFSEDLAKQIRKLNRIYGRAVKKPVKSDAKANPAVKKPVKKNNKISNNPEDFES